MPSRVPQSLRSGVASAASRIFVKLLATRVLETASSQIGLTGRLHAMACRLATDLRLLVLIGTLGGLLWLFVSVQQNRPERQSNGTETETSPYVPTDRFAFADRSGFAAQMRNAPPTQFGLRAKPVAIAQDAHHVHAEPLDPLASLTITGLLEGTEISVGRFLSPTTWTVAIEDLTEIVVSLPSGSGERVRGKVVLSARSGTPLHSFPIEFRWADQASGQNDTEQVPPNTASVENVRQRSKDKFSSKNRKSRSDAAVAASRPSPSASTASQPNAGAVAGKKTTPPLVWPGDPRPTRKSAASTFAAPPSLLGGALSAGMMNPDPKDSQLSRLRSTKRDDPRHLILRGLGSANEPD